MSDESELSVSVTTEHGRTFMAVSADGWDWNVRTSEGAEIGSFRSVGLTSVKRILAQTLAVVQSQEPLADRSAIAASRIVVSDRVWSNR
jgi:hypothetical protein